MLKLSRTTKLDGIQSWSLPAVKSCPGAHGADGELVPVCKGCYATSGNYRFPNVANVRAHNMEDWKRADWAADMIKALERAEFFRWFDSGDIHHPRLAKKILAVATATPHCMHWIPTRSHKVRRLAPLIDALDRLVNVSVRRSADELDTFDPKVHGSVVITDGDNPPPGVTVCRAYETSPAKCNGCRACWNKKTAVIGYVAHGVSMQKLIKTTQLAA